MNNIVSVDDLNAKREIRNAKRREQRAAKKAQVKPGTVTTIVPAKPEAPVAPVAPVKPEAPVAPVAPVKPEVPVAPASQVTSPFRVTSKRHACYVLLKQSNGATLTQGAKATGWAERVVLSEFYEIAKVLETHVGKTEKGTYFLK